MLTEREVRHAITPAPAFPGYLMRSRRLLKGALGNFHSGGACSACASIEVVVYPNELFARTMYRGLLDDPSFLKGSVWGYGSLYVMQHGNILLLAQGGGYAFEQTLAAAKALQVTGPVAQSQCAVTSVKGEPDGPHVRRVVTCGKAHSMLPAVDR